MSVATVAKDGIFDWPTDEGIWMGDIPSIGWFPMKTIFLRDDLPSREEMAREAAGEEMPPRPVLGVIAQFPESETSWPFTFKGCHPAKQWRRPTDEEMTRAKKFYDIE